MSRRTRAAEVLRRRRALEEAMATDRLRWARAREARIRQHGRDGAVARERALLGALMLEPAMIRLVMRDHPPDWFIEGSSVDIMDALVCASFGSGAVVTSEQLAEILAESDALERVGVMAFVEELAAPGPLEAARAVLAAIRRSLPLVEEEPIVVAARRILGEP